jgi:hypothetical protein
MGTLVEILDAIVLLLYIITIPRVVTKGMSAGPGSTLLGFCVALFAFIFALVSFTAMVGFFTSGLAQVIWLVVLLAVAALLRSSWAQEPVI